MIVLRKRDKYFHVDYATGPHRLRGSLGTANRDAALKMKNRLENALADGPQSGLWQEMQRALPAKTFLAFAGYSGVRCRNSPTWEDLQEMFRAWMDQRRQLGKLAKTTVVRYEQTLRRFTEYANVRKMDTLAEITRSEVDAWKTYRLKEIRKRKESRGGGGLVLDVAILHRAFAIAVEHEMIPKNPVRMEGKPGENPEGGAEPFTAEELKKLREHAGPDYLNFVVLRWTGLRGSDAVDLRWREVDFARNEIERLTQKRKKVVIVPMHEELRAALRAEYDKRTPGPEDTVLLPPKMTRPALYDRIVVLGKRAGVAHSTPHRFRDTLAVDMLLRGAGLLDCARILGDTADTVSRHYAPFVPALRDRVKGFLDKDSEGLEAVK